MTENSGILVEWTNKNGELCTGIARKEDQTDLYTKYNKVVIHCINEDFTDKTDSNGKKLIAVKHSSELKVLGYID